MKDKSPIILALDFKEIESTCEMMEKTLSSISIFKLGLEFYLAHGKAGVHKVKERFPDIDIFLDLKLHDIPTTVAGAAANVHDLSPRFLTVHAAGGGAMVNAAAKALPDTSITAVTVLTSLDEAELAILGLPKDPNRLALSLAKRAIENGATSIVCSPHEASVLRQQLGSYITIITPGVRPAGSAKGDQSRVMTPQQAIAEGANYVVIGRPITQASDPAAAASEIRKTLV